MYYLVGHDNDASNRLLYLGLFLPAYYADYLRSSDVFIIDNGFERRVNEIIPRKAMNKTGEVEKDIISNIENRFELMRFCICQDTRVYCMSQFTLIFLDDKIDNHDQHEHSPWSRYVYRFGVGPDHTLYMLLEVRSNINNPLRDNKTKLVFKIIIDKDLLKKESNNYSNFNFTKRCLQNPELLSISIDNPKRSNGY